jgi:serine/threonine protein kinase/Flp pilus assembly protein TadD
MTPSTGGPTPDALADLVEELTARLQAGEPIDPAAVLRDHPDHADQLARLLPALELLADLSRTGGGSAPFGGWGADPPPLGGTLGDFRILGEVGRGGMGVVYEAEQIALRRRVALKVLPFAATLDARQLQRFKNEAQAAAQLHHPNIVPVYGVGCERGVHYYAMQFIDGRSLAELIEGLRRGPGRPAPAAETDRPAATARPVRDPAYFRTAADLAAQAAGALEHAHGLGVVHRDVKPANLLVDAAGRLWVTDFGLARVQTDARLTLTGDLVGTLRYMSPEQALAQPAGVDHRADVYSLGATLYEMLTLEPAFAGPDRQGLLRQIAFDDPRPPRRVNPAVPAELETVVLKAMAKAPAERYATAQEFADDLRRFLEDRPVRARRPSWPERARKWARRHRPAVWSAAAALLVTLAVLAGSVGWVLRDRSTRQARAADEVRAALDEARRARQEGRWPQAQAAAGRAEALLRDAAAEPELAERLRGLLRELAEEEADRRLVARLEELRLLQSEVQDERFDLERALPDYRRAFQDYGLGPAQEPGEAAARLLGRPERVRGTLAAALDHWLILARHKKAPEADWLARVLVAADTDAWRQRVRAARERDDRPALERLAREADVTAQPPEALFLLEMSLRQRHAFGSAVALLHRAREASPGDFWFNHNLGLALQQCQPPRYGEAIRFLTAAVALRPQSPGARLNLGAALLRTGRFAEAEAAFRQAIDRMPEYVRAHQNLGVVLFEQGRPAEAAAAFRRATELKPESAEAHCNLGLALQRQGEFTHALAALRKGHALGTAPDYRTWPYPSARWVRDCQRLVELEGRLPAVLLGLAQPADAAERNEFAQVCYLKRLHAASARLRADAFRADPKLAADLPSGSRYHAACAAALAAAGSPDGPDQVRWRKQALDWLRDDLTAYARLLESGKPDDRRLVVQRLRHWQGDWDLAGLRDPAAAARRPADEREACRQLWADVQALLNRFDTAR